MMEIVKHVKRMYYGLALLGAVFIVLLPAIAAMGLYPVAFAAGAFI